MSEKPPNPYRDIEKWWGEPISGKLIERILAAPTDHLRQFLDAYDHYGNENLPALDRGSLRPIVTHTTYGRFEGETPFSYLDPIANILLYSHEVAVENPLSYLSPTLRGDIDHTLRRLLQMKPLFDTGAIHFFDTSSRTRHPSRSHRFTQLEPDLDLTHPDTAQVIELIEKVEKRKRAYNLGDLMFNIRSVVGAVLQMAANQPGRFQQLIRNDEELLLYKLALVRASRIDRENHGVRLRPLATLDIPRLKKNPTPLIALRKSSDEFADWRAAMKIALNNIQELPYENEQWATDSKEIILDSLEPIRSRLEKHANSSPFLASLSKGITSFSFSGVGAVAGYAAGGSVMSSLAAAGGGKAAEVVVEYLRAARQKNHNQAILDLILTLED